MTTFRIPVVALALAASLGASISLGNASAVATDVPSGPLQASAAAPDPQAGECRIAAAFPTAEAGFAIRRPVGDRVR